MVNDYIKDNWNIIETISKKVLKERFREGISAYYIHLHKKNIMPSKPAVHVYYFMKNLQRPNSEINYTPVTLKCSDDGLEIVDSSNDYKKIEMMIDLNDEALVDFLVNNHNSDKWIKIYEVVYSKKIELDMFENILFDYVLIKGWSIRKISEVTGNGRSYTYQLRKKLLDKLKLAITNE